MSLITLAKPSTSDVEVCPLCEHRVHRDHSALIDRPILRTLYRWNRAVDDAVERVTDWLAFHGANHMSCYFCDEISAGRGFGWSGELCDCCHPSHAH
ncbi:hypothetical protein ASG12_06400 [Williamsia sp. Leaf354]|uniref:hypothetical protein n=1 Tax=Williamsia sp. Leaf354 TaxID=1736349 RepID=UPI0006FCFEE3|nr:hypothetical protein [Williamsia sp. Leaf354]KQS00519.1 hypothetical protein ASG12_06400 [Williamsia sp. Leaf354]